MTNAAAAIAPSVSVAQDQVEEIFRGKKAFLVLVAFAMNERKIQFSPEELMISDAHLSLFKDTDSSISIAKDPYPDVRKATNRLKGLRAKLMKSARSLKVGDGLMIVPEAFIDQWDAGFAELQLAFEGEAQELKAGLGEAQELYESTVMENLTRLGQPYESAVERWEVTYRDKFYTPQDFEAPAFGASTLIRKEMDFGAGASPSGEDVNAVRYAQSSLTVQLQKLELDIQGLLKQSPSDSRVKPEARLAEIDRLTEESEWLSSLIGIKLGSQSSKLTELRAAVLNFQNG